MGEDHVGEGGGAPMELLVVGLAGLVIIIVLVVIVIAMGVVLEPGHLPSKFHHTHSGGSH